MLVIVHCLVCNRPKQIDNYEHTKASRKGKNVGRFCGSKCAGLYHTATTPEKTPNTSCGFCKKPLYRAAFRLKRKTFCSRVCKDKGDTTGPKAIRIKLKCPSCQKEFEVRPLDSWRKSCSRECASKILKAKNAKNLGPFKTTATKRFYSSAEWKELRQQAFERDNFTCVDCGRNPVYLEANHIKPRSSYPELKLELSNIETLCKPCHVKKKDIVYVELRKLPK